MSKRNILIAVGVTGGHILPMRYVAEYLKKDFEVIFIGTGRELEKKLISDFGYKLLEIDISGIHRLGIFGMLKFFLKLPKALIKSFYYCLKYKPECVIGGGAYVSILPVMAAYVLKIPTHIHEAERKSGIANKFLAKFVDSISVAYQENDLSEIPKVVHTGQPLNPELEKAVIEIRSKEKPLKPKNILILGGSQGSRKIDQAVLLIIDLLKENKLNIWHQCWYEDVIKVASTYSNQNFEARVSPFISNITEAYKFADLIIARAGASTTKEIEMLGIPTIFIPLPGSENNNHQFDNANRLKEKGMAEIIRDDENLNQALRAIIIKLFNSNDFYKKMLVNLRNKEMSNSALNIYQTVKKLCKC